MSPGSDRDRERDERRQYTPGPGSGSMSGFGSAHGYLNAQPQSQSQSQTIIGYGAAYGSRDAQGFLTGHGGLGHDSGEGSWRGSSPSSTMTSSATVMSPESTGSESGSGVGLASGSVSGSGFPVATGYVPQVADMDGSGLSGDALVLRREFLPLFCVGDLCAVELTRIYRFTRGPDVRLLCRQSWSFLFSG